MILTLLPNPALDKTIITHNFEIGRTFRPSEVLYLAGGKGFNFARALKTLGHSALVIAPVGGTLGRYLLELAVQEGIASDCQQIKGNTRTCLTILDPAASNRLTELYEEGPKVAPQEWENLLARTAAHFEEASFLVVTGSLPPSVSIENLFQLLEKAKAKGLSIILDTYGPQLESALKLSPALVKINQFEAAQAVGYEVNTLEQAWAAAKTLQNRGALEVVITLGSCGAAGITRNKHKFGWASPVENAVCPVGSGDSLLGGIVAGLASNMSLSEAVRLGVAAGAANTLTIGAGRFDKEKVKLFFSKARPIKL